MATPPRSFCALDLTPALSVVLRPWPATLRDHAARCPCCALRMSALERLAARIDARPEVATTIHAGRSAKRARPSRLMEVVLGPLRRTAAVAALGVGALFLGLAVGGGVTLGLAVLTDNAHGFHIGQAFAASASDSSVSRSPAEEQARALADHGSLIPLPLTP
jgi:hypothetical protein